MMLSLSKTDMESPDAQTLAREAKAAVAHACYQVLNAPLRLSPAPHFYISGIFPADFYAQMLQHFPAQADFKQMRASAHGNMGIHESRHYLSYFDDDWRKLPGAQGAFWGALCAALSAGSFHAAVTAKFGAYLDLPRKWALGEHQDILMISDRSGYMISPHTDTPQKLFSLLFYCPVDDTHPELGTSFYAPKGEAPRAAGQFDAWCYHDAAPHRPFEDYEKIATMPYMPNALFGFVRTRHSFHAVEPGRAGVTRQLLIYENFATRASRRLRAARGGTL